MTYWRKPLPSTSIVYGPRQKLAEACPCRNCEERRPGCHAACDKYKAWRAEFDADKAAAVKAQERDALLKDFQVGNMRKAVNRHAAAAAKRKRRNK